MIYYEYFVAFCVNFFLIERLKFISGDATFTEKFYRGKTWGQEWALTKEYEKNRLLKKLAPA
jgi:hypothetical protein